MKTPEGCIKASCLRYLEKQNIFAWNSPTGAVKIGDRWVSFGKRGSADILGCLPGGRFLAVEIKSANGKLSPEQTAFLKKIRDLGGFAVVVKSWRQLDLALRNEGYTDDGSLFSLPLDNRRGE